MQNFLVYKSSAGSGKTYTLVKEYLKIVLAEPGKVRNILAITFTNAAAAEMKERIIAALGQLSELSGKPEGERPSRSVALLNAIKEETGLQSSEIIRNARAALTLILHNYGDFSVSTIDSFAHRIIRSFAFDLRLPLNFDVELDQNQLLAQAIDLMVSRAGNEPALTRLLVDYIESRTDEEKSHYIEYDMARLAKTLMDEKGSLYVERLRSITLGDFGEIHKKLGAAIAAFEDDVQQIALQARKLIDGHGIPDDQFYRGKTGIGGYFAHLAMGLIAEKITPNSYVQTTITEDKWTAGKADPQARAAINLIKEQLAVFYQQIQEIADQRLEVYKVQKLVKKHLFPMAVLCELEKVVDEIKSEQSMLHISDFNRKISEIVAVETAPFIYERIGEKYHHYMIDEFQDTSGLQWQNLLPLVDNALAGGHINLVVGDGKQAIYRWRNGDVEQFAALPGLPDTINATMRSAWENTLVRNYSERALKANWRSLPEVIDFNNDFFAFARQFLPPGLISIYNGHEQEKHPEKTGGYVQIDFLDETVEENLDYTSRTHLKVLEVIGGLTDNGHTLNQITILCRSNSEASSIARFLLENNLNVISSESLLLNQSAKVNFMLSVMKLISNHFDEVSFTEVASWLIKTSTIDAALHDILLQLQAIRLASQARNNDPESNPIYAPAVIEGLLAEKGIDFSFTKARHLGLYELAEYIVRSFFSKGKPDPFIAFFMDVVHEYSSRFVSSLADFLEWWGENSGKYSVVVPEGVDAVQVMTIHKSKGLQFPVVICPFVDKDFSRPGKEGEWVELGQMDEAQPLDIAWLSISSAMEGTRFEDIWVREKGKTLLDILNVAYVAFTRPVEKLFIFSKYPSSNKFSDKNLAGFLQLFLQGKGLWSHEERTYYFGEGDDYVAGMETKGSESLPVSLFDQYASTSWAGRLTPHSPGGELSGILDSPKIRGSLVHDIMERIHTADDVESVLREMTHNGLTDAHESEALKTKILAVIADPIIRKYYSKDLFGRNECGMYDSEGRFYRADRVVWLDREVVVIDYKTGEYHPAHERQICGYASVIKSMGNEKVKAFLAYLDRGEVIEVQSC